MIVIYKMKNVVDIDDVMVLFEEFLGGADNDEFDEFYIDFNDSLQVINFIKKFLEPKFFKLSKERQQYFQDSLSYFITFDPNAIKKKLKPDFFHLTSRKILIIFYCYYGIFFSILIVFYIQKLLQLL